MTLLSLYYNLSFVCLCVRTLSLSPSLSLKSLISSFFSLPFSLSPPSLPVLFHMIYKAPSSSDIDDNNENKVLRAFQRALNSQYRVSDGRSALNLIGHSKKIKHHLNQVRHFSDLDSSDVQFNLKVTKWNDVIAQYPGMEFRAFVHRVRDMYTYNLQYIIDPLHEQEKSIKLTVNCPPMATMLVY